MIDWSAIGAIAAVISAVVAIKTYKNTFYEPKIRIAKKIDSC